MNLQETMRFIKTISQQVSRVRRFLTHDIWHLEFYHFPRLQKYFHRQFMLVILVTRSFMRERLYDSAAALAFTSLFAFVPFLAVIFTIMKTLGWHENLAKVLYYLLSPLGKASSDYLVPEITTFVFNTNIKTLGLIGFVVLVVSLLIIISSIEQAFNDIWNVKKHRPWRRKLVDYSIICILGPLFTFIVIGFTITSENKPPILTIHSNPLINNVLSVLLPLIITWFALWYILKFIPNTRVRNQPAAIGALIGSLLWSVVNGVFSGFVVDVYITGMQAMIYARLAVLPLFLLWVFFGWTVLLFVAQLAYARQHFAKLIWQEKHPFVGPAYHEMIGLKILLRVAHQYRVFHKSTSEESLSDYFNMPENVIHLTAQRLADLHYLVVMDEPERSYLLSQLPGSIRIYDVLFELRLTGCDQKKAAKNIDRLVERLCNRFNRQIGQSYRKMTLQDLLNRL